MRDRWCLNCKQNVHPKRGQESGFLVFVLVAVFALGGWALGPVIDPQAVGSSAQVLGTAVGVLVAAAVIGLSVGIQAARPTCPICGTRSLGQLR